MNKSMRLFNRIVIFLFIAFCSVTFAKAEKPEDVVRDTSDKMIIALKKDQQMLKNNPDKLYELVEEILVPRFDFETISQWVMGRSWKTATEAQRTKFTKEFKRLLINSYAGVLLDYTDEKINVFPSPKSVEKNDQVTVKSEIVSSQRAPIAINYEMVKSGNKWLVFDLSVEGVSIVTNYRSEIRELVNSQGIDGMIKALEKKNREGKLK